MSFRVTCFGLWGYRFRVSCIEFCVSRFAFSVSGFKVRVSCFGLFCLRSGTFRIFSADRFRFRVFGFRVFGFRYVVFVSGSRVSASWCRVYDLEVQARGQHVFPDVGFRVRRCGFWCGTLK